MNWKNSVYFILLLFVMLSLFKLFGADAKLASANLIFVSLALLSYLLSVILWNGAWGKYVKLSISEANIAVLPSQIGVLTPFGVANDFLRSYLGKKSGIDFSAGLAASFSNKVHKILIAFLFSFLGIFALVLSGKLQGYSALIGILLPLLFASVLFVLSKKDFSALVERLTLGKLKKENAKDFHLHLKKFLNSPRADALLLLAISLFLEFFSFSASLLAFGISIELFQLYLLFTIVFFLTKNPVIPQGIGVSEGAGLLLLSSFEISAVAAALFLWNVARIWFPIAVGFAVAALKKEKKQE